VTGELWQNIFSVILSWKYFEMEILTTVWKCKNELHILIKRFSQHKVWQKTTQDYRVRKIKQHENLINAQTGKRARPPPMMV
jgi:hypothetical protein